MPAQVPGVDALGQRAFAGAADEKPALLHSATVPGGVQIHAAVRYAVAPERRPEIAVDAERARRLGSFLRALHGLDPAAVDLPAVLPVDRVRAARPAARGGFGPRTGGDGLTVRSRAVELWHEIAGDGAPVLLLHEGICDSRMWNPQWQTFPPAHRTVRCDLRGFGRTPQPPERFSHARDVVELLDRLELGPAALVGVSLGGRVALEVAVARPDLVERLVLVAPALPGHAWSEAVQRYGEEEEAALERGDLDAAVEANLRLWVDGPRRAPQDVDPAVRRFVGEMQRRAFELQLPAWEEAEEELLVTDLAGRLAEIRVPTLVVVGTEDVGDMHAIADRLAAGIPGARRAGIENAAHVPSLERPGDFDALVLPFLAGASA